MATQAATEVAGYQEGSRWFNVKPSGAEVADWFRQNVKIHEGLDHEDYVQGIVLIPQKETVEETRLADDGTISVVEVGKRLVFTPYAKVETRIAYFWDLCRHNNWLGSYPLVSVERIAGTGPLANENLPPGFFRHPVAKADGKWVQFVGYSAQVRIYERSLMEGDRHGRPVMEPPPGTKAVPLLGRWGEDQDALAKAETGAVGRALGMAGMLVIPGSGVATYEDMQEVLSRDGAGSVSNPNAEVPAALPPEAPSGEQGAGAGGDLRSRAVELIGQLQSEHPAKFEEIQEWAKSRKMDFNDLQEPQLRGVVKKLEKALLEAKAAPEVEA